ncbi:MAG: oligosaccharide flippase family protein [Patescibacteria group bacterium]
MGYTKEAIRGASWLGAFKIFARTLSFLRIIIIARILSPSQFGVYGVATLVLALIEILTETGINIFLVQKKEHAENYLSTAWIVSILRGFLISLVIFSSSFFVAGFFKSQEVLPLLMLISLVPAIRGFINPSIVYFQKNLNFHKEFYYRSSVFLIETVISILCVIVLKDPIALIYGLIGGSIFEVIISFLFVKPRPDFKFKKQLFSEIISSGKWVTASGIFTYLFLNADNIVVGRVLGTASLGIYDMAYSIAILPISEVSDIVLRVTFPVYVRISEEKERLKKAYIKTTLLIAVLVLPVLFLFLVFPEQLILLFLGRQWTDAADILKVLAIFAVISTIGSTSSAVFYAVKKQKYVTIISAISFVVMITSIIPLISAFGLVGAGIAVIFGSISATPFVVYYLLKVFSEK